MNMKCGESERRKIEMTNAQKRNVWGMVVCFVLCALSGCFGLAAMMCREVEQSDKGGFPVEKDDIIRYSIVGCVGYIVNVVLLIVVMS